MKRLTAAVLLSILPTTTSGSATVDDWKENSHGNYFLEVIEDGITKGICRVEFIPGKRHLRITASTPGETEIIKKTLLAVPSGVAGRYSKTSADAPYDWFKEYCAGLWQLLRDKKVAIW